MTTCTTPTVTANAAVTIIPTPIFRLHDTPPDPMPVPQEEPMTPPLPEPVTPDGMPIEPIGEPTPIEQPAPMQEPPLIRPPMAVNGRVTVEMA